jgi:hypothetical protein
LFLKDKITIVNEAREKNRDGRSLAFALAIDVGSGLPAQTTTWKPAGTPAGVYCPWWPIR